MGKICAVPGCNSGTSRISMQRKKLGLRQISLFSVPKCTDRLASWAESLGCTLKMKQFVCELHFLEKDIRKSDTFKLSDGTVCSIPRDHWALEQDAIPFCQDAASLDQDAVALEYATVPSRDCTVSLGESAAVGTTAQNYFMSHKNVTCAEAVIADDVRPLQCESLQEEFPCDQIPQQHQQDMQRISISDIKRELSSACLPEAWAWTTEESNIVLTNFCPKNFNVRLHLVIGEDMSLKLRTNTGVLVFLDIISSFSDVSEYMKRMGSFTICTGTGIETAKHHHQCRGILERAEEYKRFVGNPRCSHCRNLRINLLRQQKKANLKEKYIASREAAKLARRKFIRCQKKTANLKADITRLKTKCAAVRDQVLEEKIANLPETQRQAVRACFEAAKVKTGNRRRYTTQWIYECLLMRIRNASLYKHLRDREILPVPSRKTLNRYIHKVSASTYGFQQSIFECMKRKAENMDNTLKRGVLLVDEMKLSESISFDRQSMRFNGFVYLGKYTPEDKKNTRADHALVFMFQPFRGKWVQALACFLSKDSVTSMVLHKLILECIVLLFNCGFHVDAITTDGAQWNRGVWKIFGLDENNLNCEHPCDETKRMWMLSDFPHLLKCFRNSIIKNRSFKTPDGLVKKEHWEALLRCEKYTKPNLKVAYRLTPAHLNPVGYQKMNVPLAFQLFSQSVQAAMQVYETTDPQLKDSKPTRDFCKRVDNLIIAMMSRIPETALRPSESCPQKKLLANLQFSSTTISCYLRWILSRHYLVEFCTFRTSPITGVEQSCRRLFHSISLTFARSSSQFCPYSMLAILSFLEYLKNWEASVPSKQMPVTSNTMKGLKVTLGATLQIMDVLCVESNYDYLMTARLNQDALERFFSMMRYAGGSNEHPDPTFFVQTFRLLCSYSLIKPSKGCNVDGSELLESLMQTHDSLATASKPRSEWLAAIDNMLEKACVNEDPGETHQQHHLDEKSFEMSWSTKTNSVHDHTYDVTRTSPEVQTYIAGFVVRVMMRKLKCQECLATLKSRKGDENLPETAINLLERFGGLIRPSASLFYLTEYMEAVVLDIIGKFGIQIDSIHKILERISDTNNLSIVGCSDHSIETTRKVIDFYVVMRANFLTKSFNANQNESRIKTKMLRKSAKL